MDSSAKGRILLLDDDSAVLGVLGECLREEGFACLTCECPKETLSHLGNESFSLLITDYRMPAMTGVEVLEEAKRRDPDLGVILVTGVAEVELAVEALRAGADDYVTKPIDLNEFMVAVARTLEKRSLILENRQHKEQLEARVLEATQSLKVSHDRLLATQEYLNNLIESTVDAIITFDEHGKISFANQGAHRMLGLTADEILKLRMAELLAGGSDERDYLSRVVRHDSPLQNYETMLRRKDGSTLPVSVSLSMVPDHRGEISTTLAICKDITEQKRLEAELKEMTIRDNLTGLYNQRYFYERIGSEIERAKRQKHPLSLLLIDIDKFKGYNDAHGHLEGNKVIAAVGQVILECTREHVDLGFRYGGDEFTVMLPEAPEQQAFQIANRIRQSFEEKRFDLLTLSIGCLTYNDSYSQRAFIQFTDALMYDAKRSGGNRVYVYDPVKYTGRTPSQVQKPIS